MCSGNFEWHRSVLQPPKLHWYFLILVSTSKHCLFKSQGMTRKLQRDSLSNYTEEERSHTQERHWLPRSTFQSPRTLENSARARQTADIDNTCTDGLNLFECNACSISRVLLANSISLDSEMWITCSHYGLEILHRQWYSNTDSLRISSGVHSHLSRLHIGLTLVTQYELDDAPITACLAESINIRTGGGKRVKGLLFQKSRRMESRTSQSIRW